MRAGSPAVRLAAWLGDAGAQEALRPDVAPSCRSHEDLAACVDELRRHAPWLLPRATAAAVGAWLDALLPTVRWARLPWWGPQAVRDAVGGTLAVVEGALCAPDDDGARRAVGRQDDAVLRLRSLARLQPSLGDAARLLSGLMQIAGARRVTAEGGRCAARTIVAADVPPADVTGRAAQRALLGSGRLHHHLRRAVVDELLAAAAAQIVRESSLGGAGSPFTSSTGPNCPVLAS